ncbi:COG1361 S-layer family protein [Peptoniphilus catoniae]|uniref:COG1361 S-layer family protein n=1 Tax=Peptoniphilus catoniae TaxID=1660341 RepID=UPI0010FD879E|nr:hypothetical protein [Peptoniphilus catoniae]
MKKLYLLLAFLLLLPFSARVEAGGEGETFNMKLAVSAPQTITIGEGGGAVVKVGITNNSPNSINRLTATAKIKDPDKVYIDGKGEIIPPENNSISSNETKSGYFKIRTDADFTSKTIAVEINMRYYIKDERFMEQSETIYVRVEAPDKPINPSIEIKKMQLGWIDSIEAGKTFQVPFEVINTGDAPAKNIKLSLDGLENKGITLASGLSTIDITRLGPGEREYVIFNLKTDRSTGAGSHMLNLKYTFVGEKETSAPIEGSYQFTIDILKSNETLSMLQFENITFPTGSIGRNKTASISFDLINTGKYKAENIIVTADSQDQSGLASKSVSKVMAKPLAPGESSHFTFDFITTPAAETKNYPVEIKATYTDETTTDASKEASQIVGVFVKAPKEKDPNAKPDEGPVPKLIIEEYSFSPEIIEAGKPFNMYLTFYNTNANKAVKNIKIFLTSDTQESATGNGEQSSQGSQSTASVFTPKGSSNTFYVANINPGERIEKEITLTTVPDTAAKTYTIVANFEYEDAQANKYTATEQIGVPVVQQAKLDVGEIIPQGDFMMGMETPLSVEFYNTGKATLYNVMVKIAGEGLKFDTPTYFKGNFSPGSSDQFSVNITPESEGKKKISITFSFEDSTGESKEEVREYEFEIMDQGPTDADMPSEEPGPGTSPIVKILGALIALLGIIAAAIILIRRKRRKNEEDEDMKL